MDLDELLRAMATGRERLLKAIAGVSEEQFKRRPAAGSADEAQPWSIAEVLAHLLASERLCAVRIAAALDEDGVAMAALDETERREAARAGRLAPVPQLIHGLLASRRELERLARRAADEGAGGHAVSIAGMRLSIAELLERDVLLHESEHTAQIEALRQEAVDRRQ